MSDHLFLYDTPDLFLDCKRNEPGTFTQFDMHVHNLYELDYITSGRGYYYIEGAQYPIFPGCILLIRPIDAHMTHVDTDCLYQRITFQFSAALLKEVDPSQTLETFIDGIPSPQITPTASLENFFKNLFLSIEPLQEEAPGYQRSMIMAHLGVILATLRRMQIFCAEAPVSLGISISDTIRSIILYINQHFTEDLSLDALCKQFGISKSYLNKRFKEIAGTTLWDYVLIKRLTIARQNIHNGLSIQEAYQQSGFSDYSNFYRCYVKRFGVSPKEDSVRNQRVILI